MKTEGDLQTHGSEAKRVRRVLGLLRRWRGPRGYAGSAQAWANRNALSTFSQHAQTSMHFSWPEVDHAVAPRLNERCSGMEKALKVVHPPTCGAQSGAIGQGTWIGA